MWRTEKMAQIRRCLACALCCVLMMANTTKAATASNDNAAPSLSDETWRAGDAGFVLPRNPQLAVLPITPEIDLAHRYTLPELVDLAQRNHPATRIAWIDAQNAALAAGVARNTWLPRVTALAMTGYQRQRAEVDGRFFPVDYDTSGQASAAVLSLQWLLFDFGERDALSKAAQQGAGAANIGFTAVHQQLIQSVSLAYYAHIAARHRLHVAQTTLDNSREVLDAAQARLRQGVGTVIDVALARQGMAQAELARVQADGMARDSEQAVITAIGISPLVRLQFADVPMMPLTRDMSHPLDQFVSEALARRPDMQIAHAELQASLAVAEAADAARRPKVFLAASVSRSTAHAGTVASLPDVGLQTPSLNLSGSGTGAGLFVGVSIPILDGGVRSTAVQQARQRIDIAQAKLDRVRQHAVQQIVMAQNALRSALEATEASISLESAAKVTRDAALDAYRQGVGNVTAVTLAQTQVLQAGQALADARAAAQSAAVTLVFATGALGVAPP